MTQALEKVNLLGLSKSKMELFFESIGEKKFRAIQVIKWIHQLGVSDFDEMTNVSKALRTKLKEVAEVRAPEVAYQDISKDGTRKWVLRLDGGSSVEMVLIPEGDRATLCVSSQIGCSLDCSFCSTGKQGFNRNLTAAEVIGQLRVAILSFGPIEAASEKRRVSNVVLMGMGEPLMNFEPVVDAMSLMLEDNAYGLSKRRVTLSTAGLVPAIDKLSQVADVSLAVSLHAPIDSLRDELVPLNKRYPISEVLAATQRYLDSCNDKRVATIEYTLIDGVNDKPEHARELVKVLKDLPCKLNLIPFNPFPNSDYRRSKREAVDLFKEITTYSGLITTVRSTRGDDIDAACGQLVGRVDDRTRRSQKYIPIVQEMPDSSS
ncbi:MAG: 23S rRNA (adenine(2503)-C(2))-methyltransferase RlmN [Motiliproteus sp.]